MITTCLALCTVSGRGRQRARFRIDYQRTIPTMEHQPHLDHQQQYCERISLQLQSRSAENLPASCIHLLLQNSCPPAPAWLTNVLGPVPCFSDGTPDNALGIHPNLGAAREGCPFVQVSGGFTIGNNGEGEVPQVGNSFQWSDSVSKVVGNHSLKFGTTFAASNLTRLCFLMSTANSLWTALRPIARLGIRYFPITCSDFRVRTVKAPRRWNMFAVRRCICSRRTVGRSSQT